VTKKNDPMAFATLEDKSGSVELLIFPTVMPKAIGYLDGENVLRVTGKVSYKDGEPKVIVNEMKDLPNDELYLMALEELEKQKELTIHLPDIKNQETLHQIKKILESHPGNAPVFLQVGSGVDSNIIKTKTSVRISKKLIQQLRALPEVSMIYNRMDF
jgi:DNA polymerase-3 subunit alpha